MANRYKQNAVTSSRTHFSNAPMGELEFSTMYSNPTHLTTFNGGDIVPILCKEILPHDTFSIDLDFVIRQNTLLAPTMGRLFVDFYAFFVPNRIVNKSWKNVMGENTSGQWTAPQVSLATLMTPNSSSVRIPVGSVADYYGYPTQGWFTKELGSQCHDLKFRGYLEIYNNYFRSEAYTPPIPYSKLNIFNGFFAQPNSNISVEGNNLYNVNVADVSADGSFPKGALVKEIAGYGGKLEPAEGASAINLNIRRKTSWSALNKPLKANKLHDYFTSVLPEPQKGREVAIPLSGDIKLNTYGVDGAYPFLQDDGTTYNRVQVMLRDNWSGSKVLSTNVVSSANVGVLNGSSLEDTTMYDPNPVVGSNVYADLNNSNISIPLSDIRLASAVQQVYEIMGRSGSRYVEYVKSFFGLDVENPFDDIPTYLGHFRRELDLYQTAQTSGSMESSTPQGNLTAFGYTSNSGQLFTKTFNEHGYIHIFAVVRHKNVYSCELSRDNFRLNQMDFYQYPLANISEQPVYTREINPFAQDKTGVFGYQEAWAEYRFDNDFVSGQMRPQGSAHADESLMQWNYADSYDDTLVYANGNWLKSNTAEVVSRTTAFQDENLPQFKGQFTFRIKKERPMPTYSVAGMDII